MRTRTIIVAGAASMLLAAASVGAVAATRGNSGSTSPRVAATVASTCTVPSLPGNRVTVMLSDMGNGGMMGTSRGMGSAMLGRPAAGWMMLRVAPLSVSAGTVSIAAFNHGTRTHELVVLPLAAGAPAGARTVSSDNTVSEDGSLGEASNNCAPGKGEGIAAGSAGWVTLTLKPGRYELICNLPGHYAAGMYAELDVTA